MIQKLCESCANDCKWIVFYPHNAELKRCDMYKKLCKQTNADRIRAMTDEELATRLATIVDCGECEACLPGDVCMATDELCKGAWLDWLKQEAQPSGDETIQREEKADNVYDQCEVHENCTVEVWSNSETGETSIGWWENE